MSGRELVRILFLSHRVPYPPDKGEKIRAFHELRAIASRHQVDLFTLADNPADVQHAEPLLDICRHVTIAPLLPKLARIRALPGLLSAKPLTLPYFYSAKLKAEVNKAIAQHQYDRVFVYCSAMAQYVPPSTSRPPVILDMVDVDSDKWAQYAAASPFPFSVVYRKEARSLRAYERRICEAADCVVVTTEREASLARHNAPQARIRVVPMGVDTVRFAPDDLSLRDEIPSVIFTGDMSYFPNQQAAIFFARHVLPLVRRKILGVRFLIVGRNPGRKVQALRSVEGVEVTGAVADVRPWLARASVAVAPLMIAAGLQNKILEAMASGLPVVGTRRAIQGLTKGVAALVETGDTAADMAAHVGRLLLNPQFARNRGQEGRRRVAADYDWTTALQRLLQLVEDPRRA